MLEKRSVSTEDVSEREISETRIYDAPRELVWRVWTEPEHIAKWWGPNGFTTTIHKMDVKPGGSWEFIMHGPDGRNYENKSVYIELVKPERIVYDHVSHPPHRVTVKLEEISGKTTLHMRMVFESTELRNQTVKVFKADEGLKQTLGRLAELLQQLQ